MGRGVLGEGEITPEILGNCVTTFFLSLSRSCISSLYLILFLSEKQTQKPKNILAPSSHFCWLHAIQVGGGIIAKGEGVRNFWKFCSRKLRTVLERKYALLWSQIKQGLLSKQLSWQFGNSSLSFRSYFPTFFYHFSSELIFWPGNTESLSEAQWLKESRATLCFCTGWLAR